MLVNMTSWGHVTAVILQANPIGDRRHAVAAIAEDEKAREHRKILEKSKDILFLLVNSSKLILYFSK